MIVTTEFKLPPNWTAETLSTGHLLISCMQERLRRPHEPVEMYVAGMATVDFVARGFRSGLSVSAFLTSKTKYGGRGWKQALVDDAVKWLEDALR